MFSEEQANSERRKFPRADFREPVKFDLPDCSLSGGCLARDISQGGLRLNFEYFVKPHAVMMVELRLSPNEEAVLVEGRVVWANQVPLSERYQLGVEFTGNNEDIQQNIRRYVASHR